MLTHDLRAVAKVHRTLMIDILDCGISVCGEIMKFTNVVILSTIC